MTNTTRRSAALAITGLLALAVCCLSGARALVAVSRPALALHLPYGAVAVMRGIAPVGELAQAALRTSPLVEPAVAALANKLDARAGGAPARFLALAGRLGWRDAAVQRALYTAAVQSGDYPGAMVHADAAMRVWGSQKDLEDSLAIAANLPAFRTALLPYLQSPWAQRWLVLSANVLSDEAVVELTQTVAARKTDDTDDTAGQVMRGLVSGGRAAPALAIDAALGRTGQRFPMALDWPDQPGNVGSPFAWELGKGYTVKRGVAKRLISNEADRSTVTYRVLALTPGDYAMDTGKGQETPDTWQWAMGCGAKPQTVSWTLESENEFSVDDDCPVQWIAVRGDLTSSPLETMTIQPMASDEP